MVRYFLSIVGLAFEKDYAYADNMWINSLNHCQRYLLDNDVSIIVKRNLIKLLVQIDDGEELINDWLNDWNDSCTYYKNFPKDYEQALETICPIIIEEKNRLNEELNANNK